MSQKALVKPNAAGAYVLSDVAFSSISRIDIVDVDILLQLQDGSLIVLPGAGLSAMSESPAEIEFQGQKMAADALLAQVNSTLRAVDSSTLLTSADMQEQKPAEEDLSKEFTRAELEEAVEKAVKEAKAQAETEKEQHKQDESSSSSSQSTSSTSQNTEGSAAEKMLDKAQKIIQNLHTSDYSYEPPHEYKPPPQASASPPGVPPPLSLTPITTLFMGNVVSTTYDTTTMPGTTIIYGGGGAAGSGADAQIGPRNALQFSAATITGTAGNDLIYAQGPAVGNSNPAVSTSNYAKQFILNVAGYFITLDDVQISGVPAGVSILGATDNGGGNWTLSSSSVLAQDSFTLIYDTAGTGSFDITVDVTGKTTRAQQFHSQQTFRFLYMDVTDVSQVTDQSLVYENQGRLQEIYILPTQDQPNIIALSTGNDEVHAGRNNDTITGGDGDKTIYAREGNDTVALGNGNNIVDLGAGNNSASTGSGNDTITALAGDNIVDAGDGTNSVTLGAGYNRVTTGSGDDTISVGDGSGEIFAGDGVNSVTAGAGAYMITTGSGADTIVVGNGDSTITAGDGTNTITGGTGYYTITGGAGDDIIRLTSGGGNIQAGDGANDIQAGGGNYTVTAGAGADTIVLGDGANVINAGAGNNHITVGNGGNTITTGDNDDTLIGGSGDDTFRPGLGTNSITGGGGVNTLDYSTVTTTGLTILLSGTAAGTGLNDTFSGITRLIATQNNDTITGTAATETITAGAGDDVISSGGGDDTIYGGDGNDTLTGGTGNDTLYGGDGNNTFYTGIAGNDALYGGSGNNYFYSQHAGVRYDGTNGANLGVGQTNTINYTADSTGLVVNLLTGAGTAGLANGDLYAFTPTTGVSSITSILGGSGADTITGSNGNDVLYGNDGNDTLYSNAGTDYLYGGIGNDNLYSSSSGTKYLDGGAGTNAFYLNSATDSVITTSGAYDTIYYNSSPVGVLVNFDSVSRTARNSLGQTITVNASSGAGWGVTAADASSHAIGDTYTQGGIDRIIASAYNDVIWGTTTAMDYDPGNGTDFIFGGSGNDFIRMTDNDRVDGGGGTDTYYVNTNNNTVIYLDGTADINSNGVADHIDRGISTLTIAAGSSPTGSALAYTGFGTGYSGTDFLVNIENILGAGGNDILVGNGGNNQINAQGGTNAIYGLGGNDTIYATVGSNTIDGGSGTDTVIFDNNWYSSASTGVQVFFSDGAFFGSSDKAYYWGSGFSVYQARTGSTGIYSYSTITNVENITGSGYDDVLYGNSSANVINGGSGNDIISGGGGADTLNGGLGNDSFYINASDLATFTLIDGGGDTDSLIIAGLTSLAANSFDGSRYVSIESLDVRNSASGNTYSLSASDIRGLVDTGNSSTLAFRLDTGDTFTAAGDFTVTGSGSDYVYRYYSEPAHITQIAQLNVHYGA